MQRLWSVAASNVHSALAKKALYMKDAKSQTQSPTLKSDTPDMIYRMKGLHLIPPVNDPVSVKPQIILPETYRQL